MYLPRVAFGVLAAALIACGAALLADLGGCATWAAGRSRRFQTWGTTVEGWRWEGACMMAFGAVLLGTLLGTVPYLPAHQAGAVMVTIGLLATAVLIVYGTFAFYRWLWRRVSGKEG